MQDTMLRRIKHALKTFKDLYEAIYFAPYRSQMHREYTRQRDLFLILTTSDMLGVPNPVEFYTLELLPEAMEQFHEWHRRMGMEHAPAGGFRCC
jgi:hypothetical protein